MSDADYNTRESTRLFQRARTLIPGGVNSPVRAFAAVGGTPRFIERGNGPLLWDVDGNRFVDYVMSWGPLINGHAFPPVVEALEKTARLGTSFGAPHPFEVTLAEMVSKAMPAVEMVRFVSSGTEAAMSAIRLARGFTGRDKIVKFAGNYHGHADMLLARAGSGGLTLGVPTSPGVPEGAANYTLVTEYNDLAALEAILSRHGADIAAIIVEPIAGNMGIVPPASGFLSGIQRLTREHGALFICDEVITGFRVGLGGAQERFGLQPDIVVLGKIIGGGLPVGAYGGKREIMSHVAPLGPVYQAGTLSGNPLAMAAGIANLLPLRDAGLYQRLQGLTEQLATGLRHAARDEGVSVVVNSVTGMITVFFTEGSVTTLSEAERSDTAQYARFFQAMLQRGVYLPPSQFEAWMLSTAHTEDIVRDTILLAREAFAEAVA